MKIRVMPANQSIILRITSTSVSTLCGTSSTLRMSFLPFERRQELRHCLICPSRQDQPWPLISDALRPLTRWQPATTACNKIVQCRLKRFCASATCDREPWQGYNELDCWSISRSRTCQRTNIREATHTINGGPQELGHSFQVRYPSPYAVYTKMQSSTDIKCLQHVESDSLSRRTGNNILL